jgi:ribonuclease PH
MRGDQILTE